MYLTNYPTLLYYIKLIIAIENCYIDINTLLKNCNYIPRMNLFPHL